MPVLLKNLINKSIRSDAIGPYSYPPPKKLWTYLRRLPADKHQERTRGGRAQSSHHAEVRAREHAHAVAHPHAEGPAGAALPHDERHDGDLEPRHGREVGRDSLALPIPLGLLFIVFQAPHGRHGWWCLGDRLSEDIIMKQRGGVRIPIPNRHPVYPLLQNKLNIPRLPCLGVGSRNKPRQFLP